MKNTQKEFYKIDFLLVLYNHKKGVNFSFNWVKFEKSTSARLLYSCNRRTYNITCSLREILAFLEKKELKAKW